MKTINLHPYHGITRRNDSYGWTIQVKLNGKLRFIRTWAANAEEAARRHDVALAKLRAFADINAEPNFPADFPPMPVDMANVPEDYRAFHAHLNNHFHTLINELEAAGRDYESLSEERENLVRENAKRARQVFELNRTNATFKIQKFVRDSSNLGLSPQSLEKYNRALNEAIRIVKEEP